MKFSSCQILPVRILLIFLPSLITMLAEAGSWPIVMSKQGGGQGKICFAQTLEQKKCEKDEAGSEVSGVLNGIEYILAEPDSNSRFVKWQGDCVDDSRLCQLRIEKPVGGRSLEAIAVFEKSRKSPSTKKTKKKNQSL